MLKLIDIHKTFNPGTINEKVALNGVDLHLNEGDFVTVIGGNGAGKSTMLNAVAGAWPVDSGKDSRDAHKGMKNTSGKTGQKSGSCCSQHGHPYIVSAEHHHDTNSAACT